MVTFSRAILEQVNRFAATTVDDLNSLKISYEEHKKIYEAIKEGNADLAEKTLMSFSFSDSSKSYFSNRFYHNCTP